jgi:hypothetical protein
VTPFALLGIAAAVFALVNGVPYIRDIFLETTQPHRGAWLVWSGLGATAFASQLADGASWSLAMLGVQTISTTLVLLLSIRRGTGGVGRYELTLMGAAGLGVVGWLLLENPAVATSFVVAADLAGFGLMLPKTWRDPWSETLSTYALASAAGVCSAAAVGGLDASLMLYPAYFAVANGAAAALIQSRRRAVSLTAPACAG